MKERPILFNGSMVRAILAGTKTQTRRVVKPEGADHLFQFIGRDDTPTGEWAWCSSSHVVSRHIHCPYGQTGDRIWVRESGWERPERTPRMMREGADTWPRFAYAADDWSDQDRADFKAWGFKPRPSIHMPRWASRILLEITDVRVERLQDISEADCRAEGLGDTVDRPHHWYRILWEQINGIGSWDANPWVWVVEFKLVKQSALAVHHG